jgi:hypothetical protein
MIKSPPLKLSYKKSCVDCRYFEKGYCTAFASQEPVSGNVVYFEAIDVRLDNTKCDISGKWHTPKNSFKKNIGFDDNYDIENDGRNKKVSQ